MTVCDAPLSRVVVVEVGNGIRVPYCGRLLAALGARVIAIEEPRRGDSNRGRGPFPDDRPDGENSGLFLYLSAGKESVTLNLDAPTGRELLRGIVRRADVLLTERSASGMSALGLAIPDLLAEQPRLVVATITPWGSDGPLSDMPGADLLLYHAGGLGAMTPRFANNPQVPPLRLGAPLADYITGLTGAVATLHALDIVRERGEGQHVDVSGQQAVAFSTGFYATYPSYEHRAVTRVSRPELAPYHFLPAKDGWVMLICPEEHQWRAFVRLMGDPAWAESPLFATSASRAEYWDAIEPLVAAWTGQRTRDDLYHAAQAERIPLASVNSVDALLHSAHLRERGFFEQIQMGPRTVLLPGWPVQSSHAPAVRRRRAPALGANNQQVLCEELGLATSSLPALRKTAII